ncbi:tRNA (N6-threonylcarbamoyladenosine(37)-N6)-methyltransferase TrmO [Aestuariibacter salexigens]|uniref:tRNA (N6-threonylcarbamoyladenosine(37)-N6)-methyltransferase TrmO n=1 Tax=Aestuariibacter salexigens TaxID=226010 RepID=UPI0004150A48|nr:tRNA (N6-threonylcarbamoyladenosine(37)-N6)-methyltransferase TrmO [Aestuariibacter salexigens]
MTISIQPIGHISTPFDQKFAIPRQANALSCARGIIHFADDYADPNTCRGLEQFSHLWLLFQFHHTVEKGWTPTVRPPRLGGNQRIGVFASRSTHRPNGLGMSAVKLCHIDHRNGRPVIHVQGVDLLNGTPIIDIKPYIPYADAISEASGGFAQTPPEHIPTVFTDHASAQLHKLCKTFADAQDLICNVLGQDPRPAYRKASQDDREYGVSLYNHDVRWVVKDNCNVVISITPND